MKTAKASIEWHTSQAPVSYPEAVAAMETRVKAIAAGQAAELIWLLEHPPLYTAGTSAVADELLQAERFPVYRSGRGGRYTYHGPGQRVVYVMLDVGARGADVHQFVYALEAWVLGALARLGVAGTRRAGRVGIWVTRDDGREEKIAAIGIRMRRWISLHGLALNVAPNLEHFSGIIPCGITTYSITSLKELGIVEHLAKVDKALKDSFHEILLLSRGQIL
ncbi:Octanoate-[acyl-carrier-protein]-protein-N-octanoyltransferase [invertebrate metagenome]|uniref:lipoyl(octanoyl) transferase n=1 Tax=invertebrate metagenome TaxID=1711999 RepID=A0A484HBG7_9ZZZZ